MGVTLVRSIVARVMAVVLVAGLVGGGIALAVATHVMSDSAEARLVDEIAAETDRARLAIADRIHVAEAQLSAAALLIEVGRVEDMEQALSGFIHAVRVLHGAETIELVRDEAVRPLLPTDPRRTGRWIADGYLATRIVIGETVAVGIVEIASLYPRTGTTELRTVADPRLAVAGVIVAHNDDSASADGAVISGFSLHHDGSLAPARQEVRSSIRRTIGWIIVVTTLVVVGLAWMLARRLTKPIRALARAVREGGETLALPPLHADEIGELGTAVATMHDALAQDARVLTIGADLARSVVRLQDPSKVIAELQTALVTAFPAHGWTVRVGVAATKVPSNTKTTRNTVARPITIRDDDLLVVPLELDGSELGVVVGHGPASERELRSVEVMCHTALAAIKMANLTRVAMINDKLALLGRMSAGVAHEINNPLAFVTLCLGMLEEELTSPEHRQLARDATEGVERVVQIVKDLSRLSRAGSDEVARENLVDIIAEQLKVARHRATNVKVVLHAPTPVWATCARARIGQAVLNLIVNAIDAVAKRAEGIVELGVRHVGDSAVVTVSDNGPGIPSRVREHLFDAFFTTKGDQGTGLGLYLSRQFVQLQGGQLELATTGEHGTTFEVRLPRCSPPATETSASSPEVAPRRKVLVIDDEPMILRTLERWLSIHVDVITARDGRDALDKLALGPFSLVLCDWNMPVMSGEEFVAAVRARSPSVIDHLAIMTGGPVDVGGGLRVLPKPLERDVLRSLLDV